MSSARLRSNVDRAHSRLTRPFQSWSLTWRLIAVLVVLLISALSLSSTATAMLMRGYLLDRTNAELQAASVSVQQTVLEQYRDRYGYITLPSTYAIVFMRADGTPERFAPAGAKDRPDIPRLSLQDPRVGSGESFMVRSVSGSGSWQVIAGPLRNGTGTFALATSLRGIEQTVTRLLLVSLAIGVVVITACVVIGWLGFQRAFRPLRAIEDTAAAIAAGDLSSRVPEHRARDEVGSLSRSLNAMLTQIESSFAAREASEERMRRFVTDASHELRTPLATVRGYAELYRQGAANSPEAVANSMQRIEGEATRMSGLVEDLLLLARMDNRRPMAMGDVDLTVLAGDAVQDAQARGGAHPVRLAGVAGHPLGPVLVHGDDARLRQVVTNLLTNAVHHTPDGTPITVRVGCLDGRARVEVADSGPGIPAAQMPHVFERFFRSDPARGRRPSGGHGLGLAIVAAIVEAHGGRTGVTTTPGGGATFIVDLPLLNGSFPGAVPNASPSLVPSEESS
ncbi:sensor histidine kinase [Gephyromycinifex aptenodytis]|uniref:sensor histidine kinase n=1 Tax=Gephyromycinifex aptenodytis TaxID=2716227 RepID=UPI001448997B|nr:HAMP domain-containing sensor histidine kinase [Gephyromycinifex aptenodytis]